MGVMCNMLIFKYYVAAAKKAQRMHIEGRKNAGMLFLCVNVGMWECGNAILMRFSLDLI